MSDLASILELVRYAEAANDDVMASVVSLTDLQLDQSLDLGMGSARKICQHILAGEVTWLARISGQVESKWPAKPIPHSAAEMRALFHQVEQDRQAFLRTLNDGQLDRVQQYRDSKGSLFQATLRQMLLQMIIHATHHRAQAVNALRRVGGQVPEVDYMYHVREPA